MSRALIEVNATTFLREGFRRGPGTVDYAVLDGAGHYSGVVEIRDGRLTGSTGIGPEEYLPFQRALPGVDCSLWGRR